MGPRNVGFLTGANWLHG
ncbi:hypothetical protein E2C01_077157 [Portunus trituberculatus]|uniref:Uncharacterized protein n=1 Tax=Portunus trituberculatus TaxID=210409 RepID=A0A5B7ILF5_PORTR|nr:hypothetical protein [Portunus trituberculatus]